MKRRVQKDLTTGDAARLLGVALRTVIKWCEEGKLKFYRVPMTKDRRIPRQWLLDFLVAENLIDERLEAYLRKCIPAPANG